jgi:prepilin-type processing-associated H-X9-DG protein
LAVAVVDSHPHYFIAAFADGHVGRYEKRGDYQAKIEEWWAEFEEYRRESMKPDG